MLEEDQKVDEVMNVIEKVCSYDMSKVPESMRPGIQDVLLYTLNQYVKKIWDQEECEAITTNLMDATTTTLPSSSDTITTPQATTTKPPVVAAFSFYTGDTFSVTEFLCRATAGEPLGFLKLGSTDRIAREMSRLYLLEKDAPVVKQKSRVVCSSYRYPVAYKHLAMAAYDTIVNDMAREELASFSEKK